MDQMILEHLLEDPSLFNPTGNHRAIEIHMPMDSTEPQVRETVLAESQLVPWCSNSAFTGSGSSFRLLVCSPRMAERDIWPLPLSSNSLKDILSALEIPSLFPRVVCKHIPIAASFECFDTMGKFGILLRTNLSHTWQYALALTHDVNTKSTIGILFGLGGNEVNEVLQSICQAAKFAVCPIVLPCIIMDKALDALVKDAEERRKSLTQIRFETGSHGFPRLSIKKDLWDDRDDLDLDLLMQKLTSLSDACAGIMSVCKMQYNFIDVISEFQTRFHPDTYQTASQYARQQLKFFAQFLHGVESKVTYTKSSVQDQVQTIYTLVNQRESRSQMMLAKTTRRLAELSRKDSTDMRVISAVTLVFLPATFTSTLFSASFFNFQPDETSHISQWIWLYWTITALLTAAVLASWWFFSRRQQTKALAASRKESHIELKALEKAHSKLNKAVPMGKGETFRPYLGGSVAEGIFNREVLIPLNSRDRIETGNISPTGISF